MHVVQAPGTESVSVNNYQALDCFRPDRDAERTVMAAFLNVKGQVGGA
jgi:hypothetical protein